MNRQALSVLLAERLLGRKRGPCCFEFSTSGELRDWCKWCGRQFEPSDTTPCPQYHFKIVSIKEIVEAIGARGRKDYHYRVTLSYNSPYKRPWEVCMHSGGMCHDWVGTGDDPWLLMAEAARELGLLGEEDSRA